LQHHSHTHQTHDHGPKEFPRDPQGLPEATRPDVVEVGDGDAVELHVAPVAKRIGNATVRMLAYNGSIPGPTLAVREGSEIAVNFVNEGDLEGTIHWHGLRLENRYDGTHETQRPVPVGEGFTYHVQFPDPGVYWYHPHIRQDYGQELGLYGNIVVVPAEDGYWPPANRELALTLDDLLLDEDGRIAPFSPHEATHVAMGRFGDTFLVGGETDPRFEVRAGEVVRLLLTNTANTRVFNVAVGGARMKLVGGDSGRMEREELVDEVLLAPSERAVVDVLFGEPGDAVLQHRTPEQTYALGTFQVGEVRAEPQLEGSFGELRTDPELTAERERIAPYLDAEPDKTIALVAEMNLEAPEGPVVYQCPMHPEVVSEEEGTCPKCGMKLLPVAAPTTYVCPMHPEVTSDEQGTCPKCGMKLVPAQLAGGQEHGSHEHHGHGETHEHGHDHAEGPAGIEWEDDMVEVNRMTTPANMRWTIVDRATGAEGHAIDWTFRVGDRVKIRIENTLESDHPMHHPFHIHGAGRFLVLARDGVTEPNLVWKDTVLVQTGETVDLLLDVTNPGLWMAHCHIAEHHEGGMMFSFRVEEAA
jgi:FtsP/CotA-like multicopper oxidase with cupredoxin domain